MADHEGSAVERPKTVTTTVSDQSTTGHHKHRTRRSFSTTVGRILRDWWIEILLGVFFVLVLVGLVGGVSIRQVLLMGLLQIYERASGLVDTLAGWLKQTTLSDIVGIGLIVAVVAVLLLRQRRRVLSNPRLTRVLCPECGGELHRIHRHGSDRVISVFIPVRRYQCKNHDCRWRGLRVHRTRFK